MRKLRAERGNAAVEMAFVLPLLLILLFGIIEMSLLLYDQAMITNAAREGARFGILFNVDGSGAYSPMTQADITQVVNDYLASRLVSFAPSSAQTFVSGGGSPGADLTVRVEYTYTFLVLPNLVQSFSGPTTLRAEATMRME